MTLIPKTEFVDSPAHRRFIASLPCLIDGDLTSLALIQSQAAHIRSGLNMMGKKPTDKLTVPLCPSCHARQHAIGENKFYGDGNLGKAKQTALSLYSISGDRNMAIKLIKKYRGY